MKGQLLRFLAQRLEIVSIDIPQYSDMKEIIKQQRDNNSSSSAVFYRRNWWIRMDNKPPFNSCYLTPAGEVRQVTTPLMQQAVKPMIIINNTKYCLEGDWLEFQIGDEIQVEGLLFEIVGKINGHFAALCETDIGAIAYSKKGKNTFLESDVHAFLINWVDSLDIDSSGSGYPILKGCNKITKEGEIEFNPYDITLLDIASAKSIPWYNMPKNAHFWLFGHKDEYTGYCLEKYGEVKETSLTTKANVIPCIYASFGEKAGDCCFFSLKGHLFRMLNDKIAMCFSPIETSCYSTGIGDITDIEGENAFLNDSEIGDIINTWAKYLAK